MDLFWKNYLYFGRNFLNTKGSKKFHLKTFSGPEKELLLGFKNILENYFSSQKLQFCAHNGKEFDFPLHCSPNANSQR